MKSEQINYCIPKEDEINSFLDNVDTVTLKIKNLLEGKISLEEIEKEENRIKLEKRAKEIKLEEKKEKEKENFIMGKKGGGDKDNYLYFCKSCLIEFNYKLNFCKRCNNAVISKEERKKELFDKVENYKLLKNKRNERRGIWNKYLNSCKNKNNKQITNYEKWNYYEPSTDTFDEDEKVLCLPKHDSNFQILEKKIDEDIKKRKENKQIANRIKLNGNKYFKEKKYSQAIECYNNVIDICKDYLEAYNNLALCYIKTYRYEQAIENCNHIIDYYNVFNSSFSINKDILFKAYFRKGFSFYKLLLFDKALNNFNLAITFNNSDIEILELINKCKLIVLDQTKYININSDPECVISFGNIEDIFIKLENVDIIKNYELFLKELKNVKQIIKKNELERLKLCSYIYKKKNNEKYVLTYKTKNIYRGITFLLYISECLNKIMIYINQQFGINILSKNLILYEEKGSKSIDMNRNNNKTIKYMSKNLIKCCSKLIDIIMIVLNNNYYYSDFCIECIKPILTFYFIRNKFDKVKCTYFLHSISRNVNARKYFDEHIFQINDIALENFLILINNYIKKELEIYDEARMKQYEYIRNKIIESGKIFKFDINKEYIISPQNCKIFRKNEKLEKKIINMCKEKYEIVNLFGILSNLTLIPNILNIIEKKFVNYILNITIYIIELFYYSEKNINIYYLSFFISILQNKKIRLFFINTIFDDILYFISNLENIDILKSILTIILNLTVGWNEELAISTTSQNKHILKKKISQNSFKKIIILINSDNKDIRDTAFLLLSRFYLYSYFGHISIEGVYTNNKINILEDEKFQLRGKLLRNKILKEHEIALKLDDNTLSIFINRIYSLFKNKIYLEKACINFVSNLSKYTNFINICLLTKNKNNNIVYTYFYNILEYINYVYSENWKNNKYNMEKDMSIIFNSTLIFFIQLLKYFFITNMSNKYEDIIKIIKNNVPYIVTKIDNVEKKINKNISIFLSYCFLTPELKSEIMKAYCNDTNQIYRTLIG
ncbi:conserved Plasmodium protein, unknown function [Plasmodium berghei]|uniref:Tetratricopeptide repeat protein, putative n=2 Tax=Plasmodium berghei TaxID=5821 RepID=A0A509AFJ1_PLABA|nr:tetratricopeptide repeat protein, putative [Plasmodium berghei ANKA]CXI02226.1 conserved Plasmodium protein, unknown function [Plasmodium berghei]SCL91937.1 conserved Plasmodium protein, unknown function [Plasmodium berghei]SCM15561.1 conserved Plasmodium protein, unknown function [Plasmodium berghei]SCM17353.1 conserved Plasmodium protein, unknown function [Plasmodium berghei]SCN22586.1 conserved Plasmodium protein, unknown function [Plasmodium berghei]|eukprot:XP_034420159.1 tetratricopeptide repeat protein, putative [Plasmodium berghei ANKA]